MTCPAFGSSSEVSLWYNLDPDPAAAIPATFSWYGIPMTGESLTANLSSTVSEQITSKRSYAGSKLTQGEVTGGFNFEAQASEFFFNMLIAATQANQALTFGDTQAHAGSATINAIGGTVDASRTISLASVTGLTEGATYTVIIDGQDFNYVAGATPTTTTVAAGLAALITADSKYTATSATSTITISAGAGLLEITFRSTPVASWAPGESFVNGSTKKCFVFLKRVRVGDGKYDFYAFRGVQVGSMAMEITTGALITGSISLLGVKPDTPLENVANPTNWTFVDAPTVPLMSGVDSLRNFAIQDSTGASIGVTMQSLSFTIDNQLRQQLAVGLNSPFSAGVASGRFMATFSGSAYYANPRIYKDFIEDSALKITGDLVDSRNDGVRFLADFVKVTQGGGPMAESGDQDLIISTEFRAFESASNGTLKLTKLAA
jgi:hypothetical protein